MKRFMAFLLALLLAVPAALADPLPLSDEDLTETITVFYNGKDDSDGCYVWSCRYPVVSEDVDLSAVCVNEFYRKKVEEYVDFYGPSQAQEYSAQYLNVSISVSYEVMRNDDDFFSVLVHKTEDVEGEITETWEGNTFARSSEVIGSLTSLPRLLGLVDDGESDEWLEDRQSRKVWEVLCGLVWEAIQENPEGIGYWEDLEKEELEEIIDPVISLDQDFYLDASGNLVFFILPGRAAPAEAGLLTFAFDPEEFLDEL